MLQVVNIMVLEMVLVTEVMVVIMLRVIIL